jgi:periplasmic copper chaperone A
MTARFALQNEENPMKTLRIALIAAAVALSGAAAFAHGTKVGALEIGHPWTRATPPGAKVGGGYLKITNTGKEPDILVGGAMEAAGHVEIHEMAVVDGIMKMRPLDPGLTIAPGTTVELKPGGYHVMFMDLNRPIAKGDKVKGTLEFKNAGKVEVEYVAEDMGASHSGH